MEIRVSSLNLNEEAPSATVTFINVKEGDFVKKGDEIIELSTEKSVVIVPSPVDGVVKKICVSEAETIKPDTLLMEIA